MGYFFSSDVVVCIPYVSSGAAFLGRKADGHGFFDTPPLFLLMYEASYRGA